MVTRFFREIISQYLQFLFAAQEIRQKGQIPSLSFSAEESAPDLQSGRACGQGCRSNSQITELQQNKKGNRNDFVYFRRVLWKVEGSLANLLHVGLAVHC